MISAAIRLAGIAESWSTKRVDTVQIGRKGQVTIIEDPPVIERIPSHLASKDLPGLWPQSRVPPVCVQRTGRPVERAGLPH